MNQGKFAYVYSKEARDKLLMRGYELLKSDDVHQIYVFANNRAVFDCSEISVAFSDTLTF